MNKKDEVERVAKISSLSGLNVGDYMISVCIEKLFEKNGCKVDSFDMELRSTKFGVYSGSKKRSGISGFLMRNVQVRYLLKRIKSSFVSVPKLVKHLDSYSVLIIGGGNMFFNQIGCPYLYYFDRLLSRCSNKKVVIFGVGVGPFDFPWKKSLRNIYDKSIYVNVRDVKSKMLFEDVGAKNVSVTPDPVFVMADFFPIENCQEKKFFIVNIMHFDEQYYPDVKQSLDVVNNIVEISRYLNLIPRVLVTSMEDLEYNKAIFNLVKDFGVSRIEIVVVDDTTDFSKVFSDVKFSLCNRMHSSIFSFSYSIPTLVFPWQQKVSEMMSLLTKYGDFESIEIDVNFSSSEVIRKIENYPVDEILHAVSDFKVDIYKEVDLVVKLLGENKK